MWKKRVPKDFIIKPDTNKLTELYCMENDIQISAMIQYQIGIWA